MSRCPLLGGDVPRRGTIHLLKIYVTVSLNQLLSDRSMPIVCCAVQRRCPTLVLGVDQRQRACRRPSTPTSTRSSPPTTFSDVPSRSFSSVTSMHMTRLNRRSYLPAPTRPTVQVGYTTRLTNHQDVPIQLNSRTGAYYSMSLSKESNCHSLCVHFFTPS